MSYDNQDFTLHQIHGFNPECEFCAHERRPRPKKLNIERLGAKLKKIGYNMSKVGDIAKELEKAKKNNKKGLIF